mmetsp:Transcript_12141/g.28341  ORF Transcript_12141/g.28341 Transcript_12141/m.28341 type:complete len:694 (-) Transcript_12141:177-2258(-)
MPSSSPSDVHQEEDFVPLSSLEAQISALRSNLTDELSKLSGLATLAAEEHAKVVRRLSAENETLRNQLCSERLLPNEVTEFSAEKNSWATSAAGDATDFGAILPAPTAAGWRSSHGGIDTEVLPESSLTASPQHRRAGERQLLISPVPSQTLKGSTSVPALSATNGSGAAWVKRDVRVSQAAAMAAITKPYQRGNSRGHLNGDNISRFDPTGSRATEDYLADKGDRSFPVVHITSHSLEGSMDSLEQFRSRSAFGAGPLTNKEKVRMAVITESYNVTDWYWEEGLWQRIARSSFFENFTLVVIALNATWIAVDTDLNKSPLVVTSDVGFQVAEHLFCIYFVFEWSVRFMAFRTKVHCLRDSWFIFDSALALLMVCETWALTLIFVMLGISSPAGFGNVSVLKVLRLLRLTRMARMAKLLTAMPELMILIKGITGAARSVFFTLCLLCAIVYVFAIAFRQLTDGTSIGDRYFPTFFESWNTLLLRGTLPDLADLVNDIARDDAINGVLILLFILLATLMLMNMLVGVLVEVVSKVSDVEREQMEATFLKLHMQDMLARTDVDGDHMISKDEFEALFEKPKAIKALQEVGVDVIGLAELGEFLFKDIEDMSFPDFMECILQLRGSNVATVKNIVDMRMFITQELTLFEDRLLAKLPGLNEERSRAVAGQTVPSTSIELRGRSTGRMDASLRRTRS